MATCDRCHRPKASSEREWTSWLHLDLDGKFLCGAEVVDDATSMHMCNAARDRWQAARIAELEAEIARLGKPRWVSVEDDRDAVLSSGTRDLAAVEECLDGWQATLYSSEIVGVYASCDEAKAAAEKACGVEVAE